MYGESFLRILFAESHEQLKQKLAWKVDRYIDGHNSCRLVGILSVANGSTLIFSQFPVGGFGGQ